jgi:hypothetical protein
MSHREKIEDRTKQILLACQVLLIPRQGFSHSFIFYQIVNKVTNMKSANISTMGLIHFFAAFILSFGNKRMRDNFSN